MGIGVTRQNGILKGPFADINDIVQTLFTDLVEQGQSEFESFLHAHGWSRLTPFPVGTKDLRFDIPMPVEPVAHGATG